MVQFKPNTDAGLAELNTYLATRSYISGFNATQDDVNTFLDVPANVSSKRYPHVFRWYNHIASFSASQRASFPGQKRYFDAKSPAKSPKHDRSPVRSPANRTPAKKAEAHSDNKKPSPKFFKITRTPESSPKPVKKSPAPAAAKKSPAKAAPAKKSPAPAKKSPAKAKKDKDSDDDFNLDDDSDDEDAAAVLAKRRAEAEAAKKKKEEAEKKKKKAAPIAKSTVIFDVKPLDSDVDLSALEAKVRQIKMEGLEWKGSEIVPIAFGLQKLRIISVIVDDLVSVDNLQEAIDDVEDVQSNDIYAFNKV